MRILVTNDDGIHSPGLWSLAGALADVGEVTVVAPDRDQSGIGTATTLLAVVRAQDITPPIEGVKAISVEGTPSDCVILATETLVRDPFDLVVSGINQGSNLGLDVLNSGTVGGALQGYFRGIPSIALSVASLTDVQYQAAATTGRTLAEAVFANSLPAPLLLNVNLPNVAPDRIEGVEITRLGPRAYLENVERASDGRRSHYWIKHNRPVAHEATSGTDIWAVRNNRISVTPMDLGMTHADSSRAFDVVAQDVRAALGLGEPG